MGCKIPSLTHAFDTRSLCVVSRGEQHIGRLLGAIEAGTSVVRMGTSGLGDVVIDEATAAEIVAGQTHFLSAVARIRRRLNG